MEREDDTLESLLKTLGMEGLHSAAPAAEDQQPLSLDGILEGVGGKSSAAAPQQQQQQPPPPQLPHAGNGGFHSTDLAALQPAAVPPASSRLAPKPRVDPLARLQDMCPEAPAVMKLLNIPKSTVALVCSRMERCRDAAECSARPVRRGTPYPVTINPCPVEFAVETAPTLVAFLAAKMNALANTKGGTIVFGLVDRTAYGLDPATHPVRLAELLVHVIAATMSPRLELELFSTSVVPLLDGTCSVVPEYLYQITVEDPREHGSRPYSVGEGRPDVMVLYNDLRGVQPVDTRVAQQLRSFTEWKRAGRGGPPPLVALPADMVDSVVWEGREDCGGDSSSSDEEEDEVAKAKRSPYSLRCPAGHSIGRHSNLQGEVSCSVSRAGCQEVSGVGRAFLFCKKCDWRVCGMCFEPLLKESVVSLALREKKKGGISTRTLFVMAALSRAKLPDGATLADNVDALQSLTATPGLLHSLVLALLQMRPTEKEWSAAGAPARKCAEGIVYHLKALKIEGGVEAMVFAEMVSSLPIPRLSEEGARLLSRVAAGAMRVAAVVANAAWTTPDPHRQGACATVWAHLMGLTRHRLAFQTFLLLPVPVAERLAKPFHIGLKVASCSKNYKAFALQKVLEDEPLLRRFNDLLQSRIPIGLKQALEDLSSTPALEEMTYSEEVDTPENGVNGMSEDEQEEIDC
eukprot:Rhum_TRINITY_DN14497_c10_g1::Rhum_TRINITY_DN14497_c10_g1_i1::g.93119::m.93119